MKRGELWTASGGAAYTGKPRPVVIIQDDRYQDSGSIIVLPLTTNPTDSPYARPPLMPNDRNGIGKPSRVMVDKLAAIPKAKIGSYIGLVDQHDMVRIERALIVFLGIAGSVHRSPEEPEPLTPEGR